MDIAPPPQTSMKRNQQVWDSESVVVAQMKISIDLKTIDPQITAQMVITDVFGTSGTNKYAMTLKDSDVESLSCVIKYRSLLLSNRLLDQFKNK